MEIDAAQYGTIALEMLQNMSILEVTYNGRDYLDKPPLLFWSSSLSFYLFGVSNFAYKLPSLISTIIACISIFHLARLYYPDKTGWIAILVYITLQSSFLINHDVRTDTLLSGFVIFAIWQLAAFLKTNRIAYIYGAAFGIALAMLSKGPIGLMVPTIAIGSQILIKNKWKKLWNPHILLGILFIAILLFPMCYGLYVQFDLHPEKIINGRSNVSGLYFYFWEQSFGRITGTNNWRDNSGPFYFVGTWFWSFMPWILFGILGLGYKFWKLIKREPLKEYMTLFGIIIPFSVLSLSHYKLPHYIYVTFPLWSIIAATQLGELSKKWKIITNYIILLFYIPLIVLLYYTFAIDNYWVLGLVCIGIGLIIHAFIKPFYYRHLFITAMVSIIFNIVMNGHFYPNLFTYQSNSEIINYLKNESIQSSEVTFVDVYPYGLRYFYRSPVNIFDDQEGDFEDIDSPWIVVSENSYGEILERHPSAIIYQKFKNFRISKLTGKFLNPNTREEAINFAYLIKLNK